MIGPLRPEKCVVTSSTGLPEASATGRARAGARRSAGGARCSAGGLRTRWGPRGARTPGGTAFRSSPAHPRSWRFRFRWRAARRCPPPPGRCAGRGDAGWSRRARAVAFCGRRRERPGRCGGCTPGGTAFLPGRGAPVPGRASGPGAGWSPRSARPRRAGRRPGRCEPYTLRRVCRVGRGTAAVGPPPPGSGRSAAGSPVTLPGPRGGRAPGGTAARTGCGGDACPPYRPGGSRGQAHGCRVHRRRRQPRTPRWRLVSERRSAVPVPAGTRPHAVTRACSGSGASGGSAPVPFVPAPRRLWTTERPTGPPH